MRNIKKISRKDLSVILGGGIGGCHMNGDSADCRTDCDCSFGKGCEMYEDGSPGKCIAVGGGGNPGGGGCIPPTICEEEPF